MRDALRELVEKELWVETTGWAAARVRRVGEALQRDADTRLDVLVVWLSVENAFTAGRTIYLSRRLLERCPDDDAAAFIVAHELAHHQLGHLRPILPVLISVTRLARHLFTRDREASADRRAIELCLDAGYDLDRCVAALELCIPTALDHGDVDAAYGPDRRGEHPSLTSRIAAVRAHAAAYRAGAADERATLAARAARRREQLRRGLAVATTVASIALAVIRRR